MNKQQRIKQVEHKLQTITENVQITKHLEPLNKEEQKKRFLADKIVNPTFKYKKPDVAIEEKRQQLEKTSIPDHEISGILEEKKHSIYHTLNILDSLGTDDLITHSTKKYGEPTEELVSHAIDIVRKLPEERRYRYKSSSEVKREIEDILSSHNLTDWTVSLREKYLTTVYPSEKRIGICRERKFEKNDPKRLAVHEVGVHVIRRKNGSEQPFTIFKTGLNDYLATEEGLAFFFEQMTESVNANHYRDYAGRVIAVKTVCEGMTFRDTFEILKNYGFREEQAFTLTMRAHRGGGFVKDHVYLQGYLNVRDLYLNTNDLKYLYVGKIGIQHLPTVKRLIAKGVLNKPSILPVFLRNMSRYE